MSEVRICENCKHPNDINNLECEKCGYDLSFVIPVDESEILKLNTQPFDSENPDIAEEKRENGQLSLISNDGQINIPIHNELVVGREGEYGKYFEKSSYVSRKHAIFYIENGKVLVFDASTNGTFVNETRIPKLTKTPVHCNDRIRFADITFEVGYANR